MGESQNSYTEWKKSGQKEYIPYDSIYVNFQKMQSNL